MPIWWLNKSILLLLFLLEGLFRSYTNNIKEVKHLHFWERLNALHMHSIQRRMERYQIIYVWKIIEKIAPNFKIDHYINQRRGRLCRIPKKITTALTAIKTRKEHSFTVKRPQLFNKLPQHIRNLTNCSIHTFKSNLDNYLNRIPDQPRVPGYAYMCRAQTNSLLHQIQ